MNIFKFFVAAFLFALMATHGVSAAEPAKKADAGGFFESMDGAVRAVGKKAGSNLTETMKATGYSIATKLNSPALMIAGGLGLIYLLYEVMQFLSGRTKSMLVVIFDVGIPCVFAAAFITAYPTLLPKFEGVLDVFRTLGTDGPGGTTPFDGILNVYGSVFAHISSAIKSAFGENLKFANLVTKPSKFMVQVVDLLITVLFCLAIVVILLTGIAEALGLLLIGPFLFSVGVAFGPVMIAGLVTPWTRDYFTKWVQFLVISAGLQGVINVIFTIAYKLMQTVGVSQNTGEATAVGLVIVAILLLTINSMVSQAPSITSALFPGHIGVAKSSSAGMKDAVSKGANVLKKGGQGTGNAVANTLKGGVSGVKQSIKFAKWAGGNKS